jgi:LysM repeat protein
MAAREGITTRQLSLYNAKVKPLKSGNLAAGQSVIVPTAAVASAAVAVPDPSIERYRLARGSVTHVVKSGETLGSIAKRYHTTTAQLMSANGLRKALIFPGQSLVVGKGAAKSPPDKSKTSKKTVASGGTPSDR